MPFLYRDRLVALALAKEVREFARLLRLIPVDSQAQPHPEIRDVLESFRGINKILAKGTRARAVTLRQKVTIAREFQRISEALRRRPKA